ncbi:Protein of unknown function [Pseudobutyrivibrio sp. YE44]|uniref:DUF3793 family protein n=1 Tax=Pseudobutyrivibrio sp. YE44 TaxID=1520802 RepID=UPI0008886098|nr:DUF3793 family protein [Pseudobutyrivibrio sp. YE44]SDB15409.1 Protein of unknown function [Pseudobutyrivibrio sp. YE44]
MSEEVFYLLQTMDRKRIELQIVLQCAPTIAGLKTSNFLIVPKEQEEQVRMVMRYTGLFSYRLVYDGNRVIFLVFNKQKLLEYLSREDVKRFLKNYGYSDKAFGYSLRFFQERYSKFVESREDFPHEAGVFLGYPLCDVKGFISKGGENYRASGYWKVYGDTENTLKLFEKFDDAKDEMVCMLSEGNSLHEIIRSQNTLLKVG